jgi:hypothetical protein
MIPKNTLNEPYWNKHYWGHSLSIHSLKKHNGPAGVLMVVMFVYIGYLVCSSWFSAKKGYIDGHSKNFKYRESLNIDDRIYTITEEINNRLFGMK